MIATLEGWVGAAADWIWGLPLLTLVSGAGLVFLVRSRLLPFRRIPRAISILRGREDRDGDPGQLSHARALSVALAATIGMGNVAGVAVAITAGGPGVVFWMWVSALVGMATKYFTCSLAVMYRGRDSEGVLQGGPMYVIVEGLGPRWRPLAVLFCVAGMAGCLPVFNANQLTAACDEILLRPAGLPEHWAVDLGIGLVLVGLTGAVILGGVRRIGLVAARLVPFMVVVYFAAVLGILALHAADVPACLGSIFRDAFAAQHVGEDAMFGGALGGLIVLGARRAAFSNEAGIGTAPMAHGAARTSDPVAEGLVAMLGPAIDTLVVCTATALAILVTGVWTQGQGEGITLTAEAFRAAYPAFGGPLLLLCILSFGLSSLFSYSYFGGKCASFLFGAHRRRGYELFYVASILLGATSSMGLILDFIDFSFAMMAIPTISSALLLAPRVLERSRAAERG